MPFDIYAKGMVLEKYIGYPETMQFELVKNQIIIYQTIPFDYEEHKKVIARYITGFRLMKNLRKNVTKNVDVKSNRELFVKIGRRNIRDEAAGVRRKFRGRTKNMHRR